MPKRAPHKPIPADIVPHPRHGAAPIASGFVVPEAEIRAGFWSYGDETMFPQSVLPGDPTRQNYTDHPRRYYVDMLRTCQDCQRPFLFFAREQKHWFETLRFYVDADCVRCTDCRRGARTAQRRLRRYSDLVAKDAPSRKDLMWMVDDAIHLLKHGVLKDLGAVGAVKNRALRSIPEYPGIQSLVDTIQARREAGATAPPPPWPRGG